MAGWLWLALNLSIGLAAALAALVFLREALRAVGFVAFGFRVFEIEWGVGRILTRVAVSPLDLTVRRWPIAGATIARSGSPRRHRLARVVCGLLPLLPQLIWLTARASSPTPLASLTHGPAPFVVVDLANAFLLAIHGLLPLRLGGRARTDMRLCFDAILGRSDSDRHARASYYARLARHFLERGDSAGARQALERGRIQLGPDRLLADCAELLTRSELDSVVDQGDCARTLTRLIARDDASRLGQGTRSSWLARTKHALVSAIPITALVAIVGLVEADRITLGYALAYEGHLRRASLAAAATRDVERCDRMIARWSRWSDQVDARVSIPPATRRDRHLELARLARCRGDQARAAAEQSAALLAANNARRALAATIATDPERWLENELELTRLFRETARTEQERRAFRRALAVLGQAEKQLDGIRLQVGLLPEPAERDRATTAVAEERDALYALREAVLASMSRR